MTRIINIAINPGGVGGTETFSRILNRNFPNSKTYAFQNLRHPVFDAPFEKISETFGSRVRRKLGRGTTRRYTLPDAQNETVILNAAVDFDRIPLEYIQNNNSIYFAHNHPEYVFQHTTYFGKNREARLAKLRDTKLLVCLSQDHVDALAERLDYPKHRIRVVGHTVEVPPLTVAKTLQKSVGIICRIENRSKRLDRFLLVAQEMPDYEFHIYGSGPDADEIRSMSDQLANVTFHGATSDIAGAFRSMGVLLVTSDFEGFGITIIEALSQATPVVIAKNSFSRAKDLIKDDENGFVCDVFSAPDAARKIRRISADYARFSEGALQSFSRYDNAAFVRQWTAIFDELKSDQFAVEGAQAV